MASEQLKLEITAVDKTMAAFNSIQSNMSKFGAGAMMLSRSFTAIGAALASLGVLGSFKKLIDQGDAMNDLSKKTGIAVSTLGQFALAAEDSGASIDSVANGMKKLSSTMLDSVNGNKQLSAIFSALGVSVKDSSGNMRSLDDVMLQVADAFAMLPDGATKSATAVALFGKNGVDLIPMLDEGAAGIQKYASVISDEFGPKADQFNDNLNKFHANLQRLEVQILDKVLPAMNKMFEAMDASKKYIEEMQAVGATGNIMIDNATSAADFVKNQNAVIEEQIAAIEDQVARANAALPNLLEQLRNAPEGSTLFDQLTNQINVINALLPEAADKLAELKAQLKTTPLAVEVTKEPFKYPQRPDQRTSGPNEKALAAAFGAGQIDKLKEYLIKQQESIDLLALEAQQVGMTASEYEILKTQKEGMNEINKMVRENAGSNTEAFRQEAEALLAEKVAMMKRNEEFRRSFEGGMVDGLKRVRDEFTNVGQAVSDSWVNAFSSMEDAFVSFVQTGKLDFKSLADSMIADMARIAFKAMVSNLFGLFGIGGTTTGSNVPLPPVVTRATGGSVSSGSPYLVGENGPELFMPNRSGSIAPNGTFDSSSGQTVIVNQTINVSTGVQQTVRAEIQNLLPQIANSAKVAIIDAKRRGGSFANAFGG